jgi:hypothetical protein
MATLLTLIWWWYGHRLDCTSFLSDGRLWFAQSEQQVVAVPAPPIPASALNLLSIECRCRPHKTFMPRVMESLMETLLNVTLPEGP